jgi:hypothetical protein
MAEHEPRIVRRALVHFHHAQARWWLLGAVTIPSRSGRGRRRFVRGRTSSPRKPCGRACYARRPGRPNSPPKSPARRARERRCR